MDRQQYPPLKSNIIILTILKVECFKTISKHNKHFLTKWSSHRTRRHLYPTKQDFYLKKLIMKTKSKSKQFETEKKSCHKPPIGWEKETLEKQRQNSNLQELVCYWKWTSTSNHIPSRYIKHSKSIVNLSFQKRNIGSKSLPNLFGR